MNPTLDDLLIHPRTLGEIELFVSRPAHALLITGLPGSGKAAIAQAIAANILGVDNLANYPYFLQLSRPADKKDIPIEDVRSIMKQLHLKTPGSQPVRRIIFIEDAHHLSTEAQNALLKAIEEPASDTAFILSSHSDQAVLPTIASRTQRLNIQPVTLAQAHQYYDNSQPEDQVESAWRLSQGAVGLMNALLVDEAEHPLKNAVAIAKDLLGKSPYERLLELDKLSKDKEQFSLLLEALARVLNALHRAALNRNASQTALLANRRLITKLRGMLEANASPKLIATTLALNLRA